MTVTRNKFWQELGLLVILCGLLVGLGIYTHNQIKTQALKMVQQNLTQTKAMQSPWQTEYMGWAGSDLLIVTYPDPILGPQKKIVNITQ